MKAKVKYKLSKETKRIILFIKWVLKESDVMMTVKSEKKKKIQIPHY